MTVPTRVQRQRILLVRGRPWRAAWRLRVRGTDRWHNLTGYDAHLRVLPSSDSPAALMTVRASQDPTVLRTDPDDGRIVVSVPGEQTALWPERVLFVIALQPTGGDLADVVAGEIVLSEGPS